MAGNLEYILCIKYINMVSMYRPLSSPPKSAHPRYTDSYCSAQPNNTKIQISANNCAPRWRPEYVLSIGYVFWPIANGTTVVTNEG